MNPKNITIFIVILIIVLGIGFYETANHPAQNAPNTNVTTTPPIGNTTFTNAYQNNQYGFSIEYPDSMPPTTTFSLSYLLPDNWSVLSTATSSGEKIAAFVVPNSNNITSAELRIGASTDPAVLKTCTSSPEFASAAVDHQTINNSEFVVLNVSDAAMSHYSNVKSYRIIHNQTCFVIDTFVYGTNPQVYEPPATPPFSNDYGFQQISTLLNTFRFTNP